MTEQMCLFTAPLCCYFKQLHATSALLVTEQASLQLVHVKCLAQGHLNSSPALLIYFPQSDFFLCGTTLQSQPACFSNLQAVTGAIDLPKFTELNKRLTPLVVIGKQGYFWKLCKTVG